MATRVVQFYNFNPATFFGTSGSGTYVYNEERSPSGVATINDTGTGVDYDAFDDDNAGENSTTGTVTVGGSTSTNVKVDNEAQWTIRDTVTGETFQVAQLDVESGGASGQYALSERPLIEGRSYEVVEYDSFVVASSGDTSFTWSDYSGVFDGTSDDDTMAPGDTDAQGDVLDGTSPTPSVLSWEDVLGSSDIMGGGGSTTINGVKVDYAVIDHGPGLYAVETSETAYESNIYTATNEDFDPTSSLFLLGDNTVGQGTGSDTATLTLDFSADDPSSGTSDSVQNVSFRIADIDEAAFTDVITITAYGPDGVTEISVTLTPGSAMSQSGNTVVADSGGTAPTQAAGSLLVEIDGPVSRIEVYYGNLATSQQGVLISDIHFDAITEGAADVVEAGDGDDIIDTGLQDDIVYAGAGNDTITGGAGDDTLYGEEGDDTFIGGEGADTHFGSSGQDTIDYSDSDAAVNVDLTNGTYSGGHAEGDSGSGIDGIIGSDYDDTLIGYDGQGEGADAFTNVLDGGAGDDYIDGRDGDDILYGGDGNDTILGGGGDDQIDGGAGDDTIYGGAGADSIQGGAGDDTIYVGGGDRADGGNGNDTFIFDPSEINGDMITINGSETDDSDTGDTLDLNSLGDLFTPGSITYYTPDQENGTLTLTNGTVVNFSNIETIICFGRGTRIETPYGPRKIEDLRAGDLILTLDHGPQPLRWIGSREVPAEGRFAPIEIGAGAIGNDAALTVSPQHRMLLNGWRAEILFDTDEVFAPAKYLVNDSTIRRRTRGTVEYFHMMFDTHEVVFSEGAPSESLYPSEQSLGALTERAREEIFALFPELRALPYTNVPTARRCLKEHETQLLIA
ncbi:Hint domain-containing protein [Celeribacter sp.]|uniref:Hint domain-containing protein n=1 Tax=Celeribacter sp. TaxID=1890673 RepID=UPI003A8F7DA1